MPPRGRQRLERKREAVGLATGRFTSIFETARRDLVEDVLRAFGAAGRQEKTYTGTAAPSVQRLRAVQLTRLDETIRTALPKVYRAIESGCDATYRDAVAEARINLELAGGIEQVLADSRLHLPTIELQRRVLENQATEAFLKTRLMGQRVINSYHASPPLREGIQEAITYAQVRGGGMKAAADEIFKRFNDATDWQGKDIANAVAGKFVQIGGRNYDLARYSELVAQSRFSELYNRGQVNEYVEDDYLLVQVDDHNTTAEVCMPFEGTIWSITGKPIGSYRPLSQCLNGGPPFHPRCSHYLDPIEVDTVYQRKGTEVVRTSGALYDIKAYKPNEAVEAAEERIRSRIGTTPSLRTQVGWMPPDQLLKRVSAVTPDDAGAPGTANDTAPDSGEHAGNVSPGQQLTPENVEKLLGKVSSDTLILRDSVGDLRKQYEPLQAQFGKSLDGIADATGEIVIKAPLKSMERILKKAADDYHGDVSKMNDIVRGTVVCGDHRASMRSVEREIEKVFGKPVKVKDTFAEPLTTGYRDRKLIVEIGGGRKAEIQLHVPEMLEAKKQVRKLNLYDRWQELERKNAKNGLTNDEEEERYKLTKEQKRMYDAAWKNYLTRIAQENND